MLQALRVWHGPGPRPDPSCCFRWFRKRRYASSVAHSAADTERKFLLRGGNALGSIITTLGKLAPRQWDLYAAQNDDGYNRVGSGAEASINDWAAPVRTSPSDNVRSQDLASVFSTTAKPPRRCINVRPPASYPIIHAGTHTRPHSTRFDRASRFHERTYWVRPCCAPLIGARSRATTSANTRAIALCAGTLPGMGRVPNRGCVGGTSHTDRPLQRHGRSPINTQKQYAVHSGPGCTVRAGPGARGPMALTRHPHVLRFPNPSAVDGDDHAVGPAPKNSPTGR